MAAFRFGRRSSFFILQLCLLLVAAAAVEAGKASNIQANPSSNRPTRSVSDIWELLIEHRESVKEVIRELSSSPPFSEEPELLNNFNELLDNSARIGNKATECENCNRFIQVLRWLLDLLTFDGLQWPITKICYAIMVGVTNETRKQEICNGSIALQGPHVATVIQSTTPARFCQFQNLCFKKYEGPSKLKPKRHLSRDKTRGIDNNRQARPKADLIKVVQLTDVHIDVRYAQGSLAECGLPICCLENYGPGDAGPYGHYECNIPPRTINLFMKKVAKDIIPDFIIYTGDVSGSRLWDETQEEILNCSHTLIQTISDNIPNQTKVYPCFGNHEMFPTNLYYKDSADIKDLTDQLTDWWTPLAGFAADQIETMKEAGYYSISVRQGLRLICMNTNYMYTSDWYNVLNYDNRTEVHTMITFVERELEKAKTAGEKVILIGHHSPNSGDFLVEFAHWFQDLVLKYADIIVLIPAGHKHSDHFHLVPDKDGVAQSMVYMSTAITAGGTKNPAMRVYYLDPATFSVIDYDQYYFDLKLVTGDTEPEIVRLYSAREEYTLPDLTVKSWSALVDRFETDDELLLKHRTHFSVDTQVITSCVDECKLNHICSLRTITHDSYLYCTETYKFTATPSTNQTNPAASPSTTQANPAASPSTTQADPAASPSTTQTNPAASSSTILTHRWLYSFVAMLSALAISSEDLKGLGRKITVIQCLYG